MTSHVNVRAVPGLSFRRAHRRKSHRLDDGQVKLLGCVVDVEPDHLAFGIKIDDEALRDLSGFGPRVLFSSI